MRREHFALGACVPLLGCGLILDATPRGDASVGADARTIDATTEPPDAARLRDAPALDALVVADGPIMVDVQVEPDAATETDARTFGLDAYAASDTWVSLDASSMPDVGRDAFLTDVGRDAAHAACAVDDECPPVAAPGTCAPGRCAGGSCTGGAPISCLASGECATACEVNAGGELVCGWGGLGCARELDPCSEERLCAAGLVCADTGCEFGTCLPACASPGSACEFTVSGTRYRGGCSPTRACVPSVFVPVWCS